MNATDNYISVHTIICPMCGIKQTGIVRMIEIELGKPTIPGIRCCVSGCGEVITTKDLFN